MRETAGAGWTRKPPRYSIGGSPVPSAKSTNYNRPQVTWKARRSTSFLSSSPTAPPTGTAGFWPMTWKTPGSAATHSSRGRGPPSRPGRPAYPQQRCT
eukprot:4832144-Pyramimonas_sp.AAC.1